MYQVKDVPGRSGIRIHSGNVAGDTKLGMKSNFLGCIGLGFKLGTLFGQQAILRSGEAVNKFETILQGESFILNIVEEFNRE